MAYNFGKDDKVVEMMKVTLQLNVDKLDFEFADVEAATQLLAEKRLTPHFREAFGREYRAYLKDLKLDLSLEGAAQQVFEPGNLYFYPAENALVLPYVTVKGLKGELVKIGTAADVVEFIDFLKDADQELDARFKVRK
jgi:hypothetical protein